MTLSTTLEKLKTEYLLKDEARQKRKKLNDEFHDFCVSNLDEAARANIPYDLAELIVTRYNHLKKEYLTLRTGSPEAEAANHESSTIMSIVMDAIYYGRTSTESPTSVENVATHAPVVVEDEINAYLVTLLRIICQQTLDDGYTNKYMYDTAIGLYHITHSIPNELLAQSWSQLIDWIWANEIVFSSDDFVNTDFEVSNELETMLKAFVDKMQNMNGDAIKENSEAE